MTTLLQVSTNETKQEQKVEAKVDAKAADPTTTKAPENKRRRQRRERKDKSKEAKEVKAPESKPDSDVPSPDSNILLFGSKKSSGQYMNLVKGLFMNAKHETL